MSAGGAAGVVVFTGPTLSADEGREILPEAVFLGPAACGDVYRVSSEGPRAVAIIDGFFDQQLAVWHKEILWALSRGVRVLGAASMGALRAAELADFGMVGVGRVFDWLSAGTIEDDDEVAIVHGPPEAGFAPASEAMVNIRATLERAVAEGVANADLAARLIALGKATFYPERSFEALWRAGAGQGLPRAALDALARWVAGGGRVDQKRADAVALLARVRAELDGTAAAAGPPIAPPAFEHTEAWHELVQRLEAGPGGGRSP